MPSFRDIFKTWRQSGGIPGASASPTPVYDRGMDHRVTNRRFRVLYQPPQHVHTVVDIVFVHGLTGDAVNTWNNQKYDICWPRDLLKVDIPNTRIFTFDYDADVASFWGGASMNRLSNHAENMIGSLVGERQDTETENRNVIFVVHSLGGLVVEKAVELSEHHSEKHLRQIEEYTIGIVFLGTPHSGSDFAPFASSVARVLKVVGKRVNTNILEALRAESQTLLDVEDWFAKWLRRRAENGNHVNICCFFEEHELPFIGKVVTEQSAKIRGYATYGIGADHINMTKFASAQDPGYLAVRRELSRWAKQLTKKSSEMSSTTSTQRAPCSSQSFNAPVMYAEPPESHKQMLKSGRTSTPITPLGANSSDSIYYQDTVVSRAPNCSPTPRHDNYTIAWICALHFELAAARAMLDQIHETLPIHARDSNTYILGSIRRHNVVITCLPTTQCGSNDAASIVTNLRRTFPSIRLGLIVGIGGGAPSIADIRLGDIIVGTSVIQYDLGNVVEGGQITRTAIPKIPQQLLGTLVSSLRSKHELGPSRIPSILREKLGKNSKYDRPSTPDHLFQATYKHESPTPACDGCDQSKLVARRRRASDDPIIHYGAIASGKMVMRDASTRDEVTRQLNVLCFEVEAAGVMDILPCLIIRGICNYSDSHTGKEWQRYAAATAAAYATELLEDLPVTQGHSTITCLPSNSHEPGDTREPHPELPSDIRVQGSLDPHMWYRLAVRSVSDVCLDVVNNGYAHEDGKLQMASIGNYSGQFWQFLPSRDGCYRLRSMFTGPHMFLSLRDSNKNDPHLTKESIISGQYWHLIPCREGTFKLMNSFSGNEFFLSPRSDPYWDNGERLVMSQEDNPRQLWTITEVKPIDKRWLVGS